MKEIAVHISEYLANGPEDSLAHRVFFFYFENYISTHGSQNHISSSHSYVTIIIHIEWVNN